MSDNHLSETPQKDQNQLAFLVELLNDRLADLEANADRSEQQERILQSLVDFVGADNGSLTFCSPEGGQLEPGLTVSRSGEDASIAPALSVQKLIELVRVDRQGRVVPDYRQWTGETGDDSQPKIPQSALAVPMLIGDRLEGVLSLASGRNPSFFGEQELELASLFARLAVLAIESVRKLETIERLTTTDRLTGLWTRSHFLERAEQAFHQALRYQRPLSAILIDIDRFKMLNEMHGYAIGDQVLTTVARNIVLRLRDTDLIGRYGGEEFVLLLPETDLEHARLAAERMRTQIAAAPTETPKGVFFVTISAGIASLESAEIEQLEQLLNLANQAMHTAKLAGRNQVAIFSEKPEF